MTAPEYLICMNCETPCYDFEWREGAVTEANCAVCGADAPDEFMSEEDFEAMMSG